MLWIVDRRKIGRLTGASMHLWLDRLCLGAFTAAALAIGYAGLAQAADLGPGPVPEAMAPLPAPPEWTLRLTPYGWFVGLTGSQTVRGRTMNINASFIDIVDNTLGRGGTLIGLMADFEARNGAFSLFGDLVWTKVGVEGSHVRTRSVSPGVTGAVSRSLSLDIGMGILEIGAAYEVARSGPLALDVLGGARYWHQKAELSFERTATLDVTDLEPGGTRAIAVSPSVDWLDPLIGARVRYAVAPGHELFLRGDIGGFGPGSRL